jgi:6-phosphofructokinase 2
MPKVLTLTMNPAVDVSTSAERVEAGPKLRCRMGRRDAGGGGLNVARVAHRLGADVTAVYPVGGIVGQLLRELVDQEGVASVAVPVQGQTREDVAVVDEATRQQYRFVMPGPYLRGPEWMRCLEAFAQVDGRPDIVCASGSLPPGAPVDFYARVASIVAGWGVRFVLDSSGAPLKRAIEEPLFLIKPNLGELRELTGAPLDTTSAMVAACREVVGRSHVQTIALTLGEDGAVLVDRRRALMARPLAIEPESTVGAGDSFLGAMVWALASDKPIEEAFRFGVAGGSAALLAHGTELCRTADVWRLLEQVVVQDITEQAAEPVRA